MEFNSKIERGPKKKILLADDDEGVLTAVAAMLSEVYEVETAINGKDLLDRILSKERFDLILSDNNMPLMDGIEVLEGTRANSINTPFVLWSGAGDDNLQKRVEASDNSRYLEKMESLGSIEDIIQEMIEKDKAGQR
ncbi:MAG: response regulator [Candidatus Paceibacterota bacterium]